MEVHKQSFYLNVTLKTGNVFFLIMKSTEKKLPCCAVFQHIFSEKSLKIPSQQAVLIFL